MFQCILFICHEIVQSSEKLYLILGFHCIFSDRSSACGGSQAEVMYADTLDPDRGAPGPRNKGPGGRGNERYSRQIDELDYIVPRGGYYFEVG